MYTIKQSTALTMPFFVHDANGDAVLSLTNGSYTKRISKNGAAFGAMTVTITEMENGWYSIPLSTSHSDTLGLISITFTNAGAKQVNLQFRVEAKLVDDLNDAITAPTAVQNRAEMDSNSTQLAAIVADTNELQSDDVPGLIATVQADLDIITGATGVNLLTATQASIDAIEADTNELQGDWVNGGRLDLILDATATASALATVDTVVDSILLDTAEIGTAGAGLTVLATAANLATVDTVVDAILIDTAEIGAAGAGLTVLATAANLATVDTVVDAIQVATDQMVFTVTNELDVNVLSISGDSTAADNLEASMETIVVGTATGTLTTTTMADSALTETTDDHYIGRIIIWRTGVLAGQATDITDYTGSTRLFTFTATTEAPGSGDAYVIL